MTTPPKTKLDEAVERLERTLQAADYTGLGNTHAMVPLADLDLILSALKVRTEALEKIKRVARRGCGMPGMPTILNMTLTALQDPEDTP